jgi:hypothetical protein
VLNFIFLAIIVVLYVASAIVLVRKYLRTRDVGFVWLGVAVLIWPLVSSIGRSFIIGRIAHGHTVGFYPFSLLESGQITVGGFIYWLNLLQHLIGACLLLLAVLYLSEKKTSGREEAG